MDKVLQSHVLGHVSDELLVTRSRSGDGEALAQLSLRYLSLVRYWAGRFSGSSAEYDDLVQDGMIGLLKAVRNFDEERGVTFRTYASKCISFTISAAAAGYHDDLGSRHSGFSADDLKMNDPVLLRVPEDLDGQPERIILLGEAIDEYRLKLVQYLSEFEHKALMLYLRGHSYQEMAERLSCSTKAVDNALQRVRRKLRPVLSDAGRS